MTKALLLFMILVVLALGACGGEPSPVPTADTFESPVQLANPASKYCVDQGGRLEIREEGGGEAGYCVFEDGSECEEWAFYRGECEPGTAVP